MSAFVVLALAGCQRNGPSTTGAAQAAQEKPAPAAAVADSSDTAARFEDPQPVAAAEPVDTPETGEAIALVDDNATLLLRERLAPPKQVALAPPAGSLEPQSRRPGPAELLTLPLMKLPAADVPKEPGGLSLERRKTPFAHPALDVPPLAFARDPSRPDAPKLLLGPRAHVASPDLKRVPHIERFSRDAEPAVRVSDDPSAAAVGRVITAPLALAAPVLPPPLRLSIPDPFEHARAVELQSAPADADRPAASFVRPLRPVLTPGAPKP